MIPFAVHTFGACGSKWLAREIARTTSWTVEHEPDALPSGSDVATVAAYVEGSGERYGIVDPRNRKAIAALIDARVGVLRRNPLTMAISALNRHPEWAETDLRFDAAVAEMVEACEVGDSLVAQGAPVLRIDSPSLGVDVVRWMLDMGIGAPHEPVDTKPHHRHGRDSFASLRHLGADRRETAVRALTPFARRWGYL